ncbi:MAG: hypothetical protein JWQ21_608 [Herminiimonas sp.]|nr:hypothetical protein [Herminiimonas sp.]
MKLASGNAGLSNRTEQQAAALEEVASSMEQLTATVKNNAENAKHADALVTTAASTASEGGQVVSQVVMTMSAIKQSSRSISEIIGVIDGIAFQTNILALNAAVEAARAVSKGEDLQSSPRKSEVSHNGQLWQRRKSKCSSTGRLKRSRRAVCWLMAPATP